MINGCRGLINLRQTPQTRPGSHLFQVLVCTTSWFTSNLPGLSGCWATSLIKLPLGGKWCNKTSDQRWSKLSPGISWDILGDFWVSFQIWHDVCKRAQVIVLVDAARLDASEIWYAYGSIPVIWVGFGVASYLPVQRWNLPEKLGKPASRLCHLR